MKKYLLNPFEYHSETKLFLSGLAITALGSVLGYLGSGRYDGAIDFHLSENVALHEPFIDNVINIFSLWLLLYITGLAINRKSRAIDVLNTVLIARLPIYLLPLTGLWEYNRNIEDKLIKSISESATAPVLDLTAVEYTVLAIVAIMGILCVVWFVAILYNGFKTATNLKAVSHKVYFALSIILAEALSKIIFTITY